MYYPYFKFGCDLEINSAATAAYVSAQCDICEELVKGTLVLTSDCDPLLWTTDAVPVLVTYDTPTADPAPWYDVAIPESARFLGYRVLNVTKANPLQRGVTGLIANSVNEALGFQYGGIIAPFQASAQRYDFQVLLFACDEPAMEYGYRYLESKLINGCGDDDPCALYDVEFRNTCQTLETPTLAEVLGGRWFLHNAGLIQGPVWGPDPLAGMRKYVRRVDFSIASELPWTYGTPVGLTSGEAFPAIGTDTCGSPTFEAYFCDRVSISTEIDTGGTPGSAAFIVEITAGDYTMQHVTINILSGACPGGGSVYELVIGHIPPGNTFIFDPSTSGIFMTNGATTVDGAPFLDVSGGPFTFPYLGGGTGSYCIVVEADECSIRAGTSISITQVTQEF